MVKYYDKYRSFYSEQQPFGWEKSKPALTPSLHHMDMGETVKLFEELKRAGIITVPLTGSNGRQYDGTCTRRSLKTISAPLSLQWITDMCLTNENRGFNLGVVCGQNSAVMAVVVTLNEHQPANQQAVVHHFGEPVVIIEDTVGDLINVYPWKPLFNEERFQGNQDVQVFNQERYFQLPPSVHPTTGKRATFIKGTIADLAALGLNNQPINPKRG